MRQALLTWSTHLPGSESVDQIRASLNASGIELLQGRHTLYLPPQENLRALLGTAVSAYPPDAGFKILKDLRSPTQARYATPGSHSVAHRLLTGELVEQLKAGCYLWANGLGPAVYDLTELKTQDGRSITAFVVQHIPSEAPSADQAYGFIHELERLEQLQEITFVRPYWKELKHDFVYPWCTSNLLKSKFSEDLYYVDYQEFRINRVAAMKRVLRNADELHFGRQSFVRGGRYPYQGIPSVGVTGKRDTVVRSNIMHSLFAVADLDLRGRVVLDVGCNAGMMTAVALSEGAFWTVGWDFPATVKLAGSLLPLLGFTRFTLHGATLSEDYQLEDDIPLWLRPSLTESVIFYMAMRRHIGFVKDLAKIPWKWMVYESHQGDLLANLQSDLQPLKRLAEISTVAVRQYRDGDSRSRFMALLARHT